MEELLADAPDNYVQTPDHSTSYEKLYANKNRIPETNLQLPAHASCNTQRSQKPNYNPLERANPGIIY